MARETRYATTYAGRIRHAATALLDERHAAQLRAMRARTGERQLATQLGIGIVSLQALLDNGGVLPTTIARVVARLDDLARERGAA